MRVNPPNSNIDKDKKTEKSKKKYLKKADSKTTFICTEGDKILEAVQRAIELHKSEQNLGRHRADNNAILFHQSAASLRPGPKPDEP